MSRNDDATTAGAQFANTVADAVRTLASQGVAAMDARDGEAEITLEGGFTMQISLDEGSPATTDARDASPATTDARDDGGSDDEPETDDSSPDKADFRCSCGKTFDGRQAALGHTGGAGDGHTLARDGSGDASDAPSGDDASGARVTPDDVTPSDLTETFAKDNAEALTEGTGYEATAQNAGKAVARAHGGAWSQAFGHDHECAAEDCDRVIPEFKPSEGATCPMHDADDVPANTGDAGDATPEQTRAEYVASLISEGMAPNKAEEAANARFA